MRCRRRRSVLGVDRHRQVGQRSGRNGGEETCKNLGPLSLGPTARRRTGRFHTRRSERRGGAHGPASSSFQGYPIPGRSTRCLAKIRKERADTRAELIGSRYHASWYEEHVRHRVPPKMPCSNLTGRVSISTRPACQNAAPGNASFTERRSSYFETLYCVRHLYY
jgi:hypothetical protein